MLKLTGGINQNIAKLNRGDDHKYTPVMCTTCHRGQENPFLIEQVMDDAIAEGGTSAAQAKYTELKAKYYGDHTYDFTGFTLAEYASGLNNSDNASNALAMAQFGVENFPKEAYAHTVLGNIYMGQENYPEAISAYEASLAIAPDQGGVMRQLEAAKVAQ